MGSWVVSGLCLLAILLVILIAHLHPELAMQLTP